MTNWGFFMKDSKEKEHRISNLKDLINNIKDDNVKSDSQEEDTELINYFNEDPVDFDVLEIDDEFIYHPDDDKDDSVNLEEIPIDEDFIIKTPKEELEESVEISDFDETEDVMSDLSENFDYFVNAKIGKTPILAIISSILGVIFVITSIFIFESRSDRVIDNVASGETNVAFVIVLAMGILLLLYGIYRIFDMKNPIASITNSINDVDLKEEKDTVLKEETEKIIPKSNIPLDKESYKIGEFNIGDLKNKFKKPTPSKESPLEEEIDDIPPAKKKDEDKKELTAEEIEDIEYKQTQLDSESIDDIFAEVEDIDEISADSKKDK